MKTKTIATITVPRNSVSADQIRRARKKLERAGMAVIVLEYNPNAAAPPNVDFRQFESED